MRVALPDEVDPRALDAEVRRDLRSLAKDTADLVARHLVMAGRLIEDDAEQALAHARAAGALAGRVAAVREAVGLTAYAAEQWAEALSELRAARRLNGRADHIAVLADCERALGRPERSLAMLTDPDVAKLEQATRVELVIVVAGARRDMQQSAAVLLLQGPARATTARRPWATRLWYAYAEALLDADRADESREWFAKAAEHDGQGETDALDRLLILDGVVFQDPQEADDDEAEPPAVDLAPLLGPKVRVALGLPARQPGGRTDADPTPAHSVRDSGTAIAPSAVADPVAEEPASARPASSAAPRWSG